MGQHHPLTRPMSSDVAPVWPGALWVGVLDDLPDTARLPLDGAEGYHAARLLVRHAGRVRGFVETPVVDGAVDVGALRVLAAGLPPVAAGPTELARPVISVALCTRDRPDQLLEALSSVLACDYPGFEVVVVDNASATDATRVLVEKMTSDDVSGTVPLRYVAEPRPGLACARNAGVRAATGSIVAFTDDDVVVDALWLHRLADGFSRAPDVTCVTGLVPSGELRTPLQSYFEQRVSWASSCAPQVYRLAEPPPEVPLFPFRFGLFGTGANFAMRRSALIGYGGFDEAFGAGSPTKGGEDTDMFLRVLFAGDALAVEPSAIVWHRHRADVAALHDQAVGYGLGVGALVTKIVLQRTTSSYALRRAVAGLRRARDLVAAPPAAADPDLDPELRAALKAAGAAERRALLAGPRSYRRARRAGLSRTPLATSSTGGTR